MLVAEQGDSERWAASGRVERETIAMAEVVKWVVIPEGIEGF